jgi:hypothetical protein
MNLDIVRKLIDETKAELNGRFGSYDSRQGVGGELDSISYIIDRLTQWDNAKADFDKRELYVYLEALKSHFSLLFEMFDEMDAE